MTLDELLKDKTINPEEILPQTFMDQVNYQLVIRGFGAEWTATYEWGQFERFGDITAHGEDIESALKEMLYYFLYHDAFKYHRHLLKSSVIPS